jgi:hypothetical protein
VVQGVEGSNPFDRPSKSRAERDLFIVCSDIGSWVEALRRALRKAVCRRPPHGRFRCYVSGMNTTKLPGLTTYRSGNRTYARLLLTDYVTGARTSIGLGRYETPDERLSAEQKRMETLDAWEKAGRRWPLPRPVRRRPESGYTVAHLVVEHLEELERNGAADSAAYSECKVAYNHLKPWWATDVNDFGPAAMNDFRKHLIRTRSRRRVRGEDGELRDHGLTMCRKGREPVRLAREGALRLGGCSGADSRRVLLSPGGDQVTPPRRCPRRSASPRDRSRHKRARGRLLEDDRARCPDADHARSVAARLLHGHAAE